MRARAARAVVHCVGRCWDRSYAAWTVRERDGVRSRAWAYTALQAQIVLLPIARKLDTISALDQMALEGWWG